MHPKVLAKYQQEAPEMLEDYLRKEPANDVNLKSFWQKVKATNNPVKTEIYKLIRIKNKGTEHFYYHVRYTSKDVLGNKIQAMEPDKGYYEDPLFISRMNQDGSKQVTEIEGTERVYELEWPKDFTQELQNQVIDTVDLLVISMGRKYGGFDYHDFVERSFEDLVMFGRFGTYELAQQQAIKKRNANKT